MNKQNPSRGMHLGLGVVSIFIIVVFTLQNSELVTVNFLFWKLEMSRVILILAVLLIGFILGYLFHSLRKRQLN